MGGLDGWMDGWEDGCMYVCLSLCAHESWGVVFNTFSSNFFFSSSSSPPDWIFFLNGFFNKFFKFIYFKF